MKQRAEVPRISARCVAALSSVWSSVAKVQGDGVISGMTKAAFEVQKGTREVLTLSEAEVTQYLDPAELLGELEASFGALARGEVQCPPRPEITIPGKGFSLAMSAWQPGFQLCVKVVNVFDGNLARDLPNHLAILNLFDAETGTVTCVMDATYITGIRTAAAAVLSHNLLSRPESRIASIVGAGVQAREHLRLLPLVREFDEIQICSLEFEHAERLARLHPKAHAIRDAQTAIERSDIVCLATHSAAAVIEPRWVRDGTHVSSVGYHPPNGELPRALMLQHRLFVETMDAFSAPPVGCAELTGVDVARGTTLGDVVNDRRKGRTSDSEITIYKAMGIAMEDMVAANLAYRTARRFGGGASMKW
jgi:alanine dehydrogenase